MKEAVVLAEVWRGPFMESVHRGHAVICDGAGAVVEAWGDPDALVLPRSSAKMIQALPLIESGAADAFRLSSAELALACASHNGATIHTEPVQAWLARLDFAEPDLRCGTQFPDDRPERTRLIKGDLSPCQVHNNCSGKHTGFLTLGRHLGAGPEYIEADHPVQVAALEAFERCTGEPSPGFGVDGCSAPNFATTMTGMARAMARFAQAGPESAERRLFAAMVSHPELVAGEGRACTRLMRACEGRAVLKTGAEGYFVAILPEIGRGVALKIEDGGTRAAECAIAAILVRLGVLPAGHPEALAYTNAPITNRRGLKTGHLRAAPCLI